jgi:hypothetical protein
MRKGGAFPISGVIMRHDSGARKATIWMTGVILLVLPGALGLFASSTIAWLYRTDTFAEYFQIITFVDVRVVIGVRRLMSTFTSTLNIKATTPTACVFYARRKYLLELCYLPTH